MKKVGSFWDTCVSQAEGRERKLRDRYDANALRIAIERAVQRANEERSADNQLPRWNPYQLRHAALSRIRSAQIKPVRPLSPSSR